MSKYWKKRFEQLTVDAYDNLYDYKKELEQSYKKLSENIELELLKWYSKYATNNELDLIEAKKLLTEEELKAFQMSLEEFREKAIDGNYAHELDNVYFKSRISRLQALQTQIKGYISELYSNEAVETNHLLTNTYMDTYYKTIHEVEKTANVHTNFAMINPDLAQTIVNKPWLEKNFSKRIWDNRNKLVSSLEQVLLRGLILGHPIDKMTKEIADRCGVSMRRARTLIETETTHILEESTAKAYEETGVGEYEYMATLEGHTCGICGELDGMVFKLRDREIGANYPPIHPKCRCTTVPFFDDEFTINDKRIAKDKEGVNIHVPSNISFENWKKSYIKGT